MVAAPLPAWARKYVGLPWADGGRGPRYDCWGLCQHVWREEFGLEVPSYREGYATAEERETIAALIRGELATGPWRRVEPLMAQPGDGVLLRVLGEPIHVGVVLAAPKFLHMLRGANAVIEDWTGPHWSRRLLGVYRHEALA